MAEQDDFLQQCSTAQELESQDVVEEAACRSSKGWQNECVDNNVVEIINQEVQTSQEIN